MASPKKILAWFGFGPADQGAGDHGSRHEHGDTHGHGHTHGLIDPSIATTERGIWAIKWSFVLLAITAVLQLIVVVVSGSVALLADTIHNIGDATTAIPLWIAFVLVRRPPTKMFNYGLGRVEDLAGMLIVLIILFSAMVAGYEAIDRLINPKPITQIGWVMAAGIIGFLGNEAVAVFRIKVGREINSTALVADGYHARTDGLTSLAVVFGAIGVWLGFPLADPLVGLLITIAIFGIVWQSARAVVTRALDGVEPSVTEEVRHAVEHVPGVSVVEAKARWLGHRLHADIAIAVDPALPVGRATKLSENIRRELMDHLPALRSATITLTTPEDVSGLELSQDIEATGRPHHGHHHAPEPFIVNGRLATGSLAIVDTPAGERFRFLVATHAAEDLRATVIIDRPNGPEVLLLQSVPGDHHVLESLGAPVEPHEFAARLELNTGLETEVLSFQMTEPAEHAH
jgi:cation diffusion facilitator family transporter